MKIALNIETIGANRGGAEKYAGMLVRWLAASGHEVHVFSRIVDEEELPAGITFHGVRPTALPGMGWMRAYQFGAASAKALSKHQFDLIVGFVKVWYQNAYVAVGGAHPASLVHNSQRFRNPIARGLWWMTKLLSPKQWIFKSIERKQFGGMHQPFIIAPSQLTARHFEYYHGISRHRIAVVPNGIDSVPPMDWLEHERTVFRRRNNLANEDVAVLFAAHNYALKGLEPLLRSFAPVARAHANARLLVCGGRQSGRYRRLAQRLQIADKVQFLGFVDDIREAFAGADLFAFPTFYDPCSLVVPEAMSAGLPVITTEQNGAADLIDEGVNGFVIEEPWALAQLTDRIEQLVTSSEKRRRMGQLARSAAHGFTLDVRMPQMLAALNKAAVDFVDDVELEPNLLGAA
jgi:UDP-glucose:(heptosyl)LPS alpha-1,3-glucosyltransferase